MGRGFKKIDKEPQFCIQYVLRIRVNIFKTKILIWTYFPFIIAKNKLQF